MPKDKPLRKHHLRPAPPDLVATLEERFKEELTKLDDEVRDFCLPGVIQWPNIRFSIFRFLALADPHLTIRIH